MLFIVWSLSNLKSEVSLVAQFVLKLDLCPYMEFLLEIFCFNKLFMNLECHVKKYCVKDIWRRKRKR